MNDFNLYSDQLTKLKRPKTEDTLVVLFLDLILEPKYDVAKSLCHQLKYTSVAACMEAIRFHNSTTMRDEEMKRGVTLQALRAKVRQLEGGRKQGTREGTPPATSPTPTTRPGKYYRYKEWEALSAEEKKAVLAARGTLCTPRRAKGGEPKMPAGTPPASPGEPTTP